MSTEERSLAAVVGENARRLRGDATADRLARAARLVGLNWGTGRISDLEHGRVSPTIPTLVALAFALGSVRGEPVAVADLLECDGSIQLTDRLTLRGSKLQQLLQGDPVKLTIGDLAPALQDDFKQQFKTAMQEWGQRLKQEREETPAAVSKVPLQAVIDVRRDSGEAEARIAKSLGIQTNTLATVSAYLWGMPLSAERNRRAGADANAQQRGQITRQLKAEVQRVLDGNDK